MPLVVELTHFESWPIKNDLLGLVQEGTKLDFPTILGVFLQHEAGPGNSVDSEARNDVKQQVWKAQSSLETTRRALEWLFDRAGNPTNPFETTLENLNRKSGRERSHLRTLFKAAINAEKELHWISKNGIMDTSSMAQLMFVSKHNHASDLIGKVFCKGPCASVFTYAVAARAWKLMGRPEISWPDLRLAVFMRVIAHRTKEKGQLRYDFREKTSKGRIQLVSDMVNQLKCSDFEHTRINPFRANPSREVSHVWNDVYAETCVWLLAQVQNPAALLNMPIPLCVRNGTSLIYTKIWYDMEEQMLRDLEWYLPTEPKMYPSEVCPVCLETFQDGGGKDDTGPATAFLNCGHSVCKACFARCEVDTQGKGKSLRKCPICRKQTYLMDLFDKAKFDAWYEEHRGDKKFTTEQMAPLYAMIESPGIAFMGGGPGTGKSETVGLLSRYEREMCERHPESAEAVGRSIFVAPTGAAAKNVGDRLERNHFQVNTVHTWLISLHKKRRERREMRRSGKPFGESEFAVPFLFVDEAGMLGHWMASLVLHEARAERIERIMFIGDRYQLPPVKSIGSLFAACCLCSSPRIEKRIFNLTENFRTDVKGINDMLTRIKDVMESIEKRQLGGKGPVKKLDEACFYGKRDDNSISLKTIPEDASTKQTRVLNEVKAVLCELEEVEKLRSGDDEVSLSDSTCVLSAKRQKSHLLDTKHLKASIEAQDSIEPYLDIMSLMNTERRSKRRKSDQDGKGSIGTFVKGDRVMCLENVSVDGNNSVPKRLVLSNG